MEKGTGLNVNNNNSNNHNALLLVVKSASAFSFLLFFFFLNSKKSVLGLTPNSRGLYEVAAIVALLFIPFNPG